MVKKIVKGKRFLFGLLFLILIINFVQAQSINPNEYLNEFSEKSENCSVIDGYFYSDYNNNLGFTSIYRCCNEKICIDLPFDIYNKRIYDKWDMGEQFNINYMRSAIKEGKVKPSEHFPESFDLCSYFSDKLDDQEVALAVKTADEIKQYAPQNYRKIYEIAKGAGVATGVITEFDIGVFVVAVGCNHLSKQEEEAFFKAGECYQYLQSIESGTTNYKINSQVSQCMSEAETQLNGVLDSWAQQVKGALNTVVATGKALWDWGKNVAQGDLNAKFEISPTSYDVAKGIRDKIQIEKTYLFNPNEYSLTSNAEKRFSEKQNESNLILNEAYNDYLDLNGKVMDGFYEFFLNLFAKPNVDYSKAREEVGLAKQEIDEMKNLIKENKFNSASALNESISRHLLNGEEEFSKNYVKQSTDWLTIFLIILIVLGIGYSLFRKII